MPRPRGPRLYAICAAWVQKGIGAVPTVTGRSPRVRQFLHHFRESAGERMEAEADHVPAARADHGAKDHVGFEDFSIDPVDAGAPPRLPDIVEQEDAADRCLDPHDDFGVAVAKKTRAAGILGAVG